VDSSGRSVEEVVRSVLSKYTMEEIRSVFPADKSEVTKRYWDGLSESAYEVRCRAFRKPPLVSLEGCSSEFKDWLTGFWEGDGTIDVGWDTTFRIEFVQKDRSVLDYISAALGSKVSPTPLSDTGCWVLGFARRVDAEVLLELFCERVVTPPRVLQIQMVICKYGLDFCVRGNKPTFDWLSGFWDAEGSSSLGSSLEVMVTQKDLESLEIIRDFVGSGRIYKSSAKGSVWYDLRWIGVVGRDVGLKILQGSKYDYKKAETLSRIVFWGGG